MDKILDAKQIEEIKEHLKSEGIKKYSLYEIQQSHLKKALNYRKLLLYVNVPIMVGIPVFFNFAPMAAAATQKADLLFMVAHLSDCFFFLNSILIYSFLKRVVTSIDYNTETGKLEFKQLSSALMTERFSEVDP